MTLSVENNLFDSITEVIKGYKTTFQEKLPTTYLQLRPKGLAAELHNRELISILLNPLYKKIREEIFKKEQDFRGIAEKVESALSRFINTATQEINTHQNEMHLTKLKSYLLEYQAHFIAELERIDLQIVKKQVDFLNEAVEMMRFECTILHQKIQNNMNEHHSLQASESNKIDCEIIALSSIQIGRTLNDIAETRKWLEVGFKRNLYAHYPELLEKTNECLTQLKAEKLKLKNQYSLLIPGCVNPISTQSSDRNNSTLKENSGSLWYCQP